MTSPSADPKPELDRPVTGRNAIRRAMRALNHAGIPWAEIGAKFGITGGLAYRIAKQRYWPKNPALRRKLIPAKPRERKPNPTAVKLLGILWGQKP